MKNVSTKFFMFILLLALGACKKDDETTQKVNTFSVKVTQNVALPYIVTSKDNIVFDVTVTSGSANKIKNAVLSLDGVDLYSATASASNEIVLQYTYKVKGEDVGSLIFRLTVTDEEGASVDKDFIVYVQSAPADIAITIPSEAPSEIKDDELADFDITVTSENDLKYIKTFLGGTEITDLTKETFVNPKEDAYHFTYQPTVADADKTLTFTIEVMDVLGNIVKQDYSLNIIRSKEVDFNSYADVNLGAQRSTVAGPFFNANTGEVYVTAGAAAKSASIDMVNYWSGSSSFYNIVSPTYADVATHIYTVAAYGEDAMVNWETKNQTFFKKITLTRSAFDLLASAAEIEALYTGSSVAESLASGGVANNDAVVFKIASGKYGVMYIKSRSTNNNTGHLIIDIKVQK